MFLYFYLKGRYTSNVTRLGRIVGNLEHRIVAAVRAGVEPPRNEAPESVAVPPEENGGED